jgi:valyl-tRNA synthetase
MDPKFIPSQHEEEIYSFWEKNGYLKPTKGKPYTVLMPPPNANASLHAGHGMYTTDDIIVRYKRLQGFASLWIPGRDHAGIETQYVYEKYLAKQGKSRMDFDRKTLYNNIYDFVKDNSGLIFSQFKRLGFLADWDRTVFTLDPEVVNTVYKTFEKMEKQGIIYRENYMVSYCTHDGTTLAELEIMHEERKDPLYYMKYGPFVVATVRPETKFGDTAVAVHPADKRYAKWVGKEIEVQGLTGKFTLKVIADEFVDPKFGTGVVKVTPAHDPNDFEMGKRHKLEVKQVIGIDGRLNELAGSYKGMKVKAARQKIAEDLEKAGLMERVDTEYMHSVAVCYKCKHDLEPMVIPNWFVRVKDLKQRVIDVVKKDEIKFHPKKYKKQILQWLEVMHDWPISRQNVWGIRIPIWYQIDEKQSNIWVWWKNSQNEQKSGPVNDFLKQGIPLTEIENGLQKTYALAGTSQPSYVVSSEKPGQDFLPETDTFDTWYSSGQWPLVTLKQDEFASRYPTDFMGTLADILNFWISRMIMFSLYIRDEIPFKNVYLWSMVADGKGQKMSKSKGNVINPLDYIDKYGADAFRSSLLFGVTQGGQVNLSEAKVIGMRNFTNKIWNIGRYLEMSTIAPSKEKQMPGLDSSDINKILTKFHKEFDLLQKKYTKYMDAYNFSSAFGEVYEFLWHRYADIYIEQLKDAIKSGNIKAYTDLKDSYLQILIMLHPFMPFVTEAVWKVFKGENTSILDTNFK